MSISYILGFMSYCSHDPAACLGVLDNETGKIKLLTVEEGFLSRRKKSYHFPLRSIHYLLDYFDLEVEDITHICVDYMGAKSFSRTSRTYRPMVGDYIRSQLRIGKKTEVIYCPSHHMAHAYSTYIPSGFDESCILVVDGLGSEQQTHSIFHGKGRKLEVVHQQVGTGIGQLYTLVTKRLGFDDGEEGKTMGLAAYGVGAEELDSEIPSLSGTKTRYGYDFSNICRRSPSSELKIETRQVSCEDQIYSPYFTRLAYRVQEECEDVMLHLASCAIESTGTKNLCLAGGVALNCVANERLGSEVKNLFVQPASGDSGIPMGLVLYAASRLSMKQVTLDKEHIDGNSGGHFKAYSIDNENHINRILSNKTKKQIDKLLSDHGKPVSIERVVELLASENVGCVYDGGIEIGPRALGHRSFIASPMRREMKEVMNRKIKHREAYRPFAPVILEEEFCSYFKGNAKSLYRYMLGAPVAKEKCVRDAPAVVHVDKTARVQTLGRDGSLTREILEAFYKQTGVPILINTSLNDNNEPIVFSHLDALLCFIRTNADFLIVNSLLIERSSFSREALGGMRKSLEELQRQEAESLLVSALDKLTTIKSSSLSLRQYAEIGLRWSSFNRCEALIERFVSFLLSLNGAILYCDEYHLDRIREVDNLFPSSRITEINEIVVVEDSARVADSIPQGAVSVLYNISAIRMDLDSFYELEDKIVPPLCIRGREGQEESQYGAILETYENRLDLEIEDFFNEIKV